MIHLQIKIVKSKILSIILLSVFLDMEARNKAIKEYYKNKMLEDPSFSELFPEDLEYK